ncbi:MAG: S1 RNA-binding domain-containing protein, partial [Ferrovibrio sp.]
IGVHQDGLVHVSALADRFVKDPHSVVKAGDIVKVKVLEVDLPRKRIALSMRLADEVPRQAKVGAADTAPRASHKPHQKPLQQTRPASAMALALAKLKR